jgi:hypothetical protein
MCGIVVCTGLYNKERTAKQSNMCKECTKVKGVRPDFVDFNTNTIYELKPNNPAA